MYGEICFSQKMFTNKLNMSFLLRTTVEMTVHGVETLTHSLVNRKFQAQWLVKKSHADRLLAHEKAHHCWFHW